MSPRLSAISRPCLFHNIYVNLDSHARLNDYVEIVLVKLIETSSIVFGLLWGRLYFPVPEHAIKKVINKKIKHNLITLNMSF